MDLQFAHLVGFLFILATDNWLEGSVRRDDTGGLRLLTGLHLELMIWLVTRGERVHLFGIMFGFFFGLEDSSKALFSQIY